MTATERKVYVCPEHGEVLNVVGMGLDRPPLHAAGGCGQAVDVVRLVPDTQLSGAVFLTDTERERLLWWLHRPVPPGPMKDLDERIIHKIKASSAA